MRYRKHEISGSSLLRRPRLVVTTYQMTLLMPDAVCRRGLNRERMFGTIVQISHAIRHGNTNLELKKK